MKMNKRRRITDRHGKWYRAVSLMLVMTLAISMLSGCGKKTENNETEAGTETGAETGDGYGTETGATDGADSEEAVQSEYIPGVLTEETEKGLKSKNESLSEALEAEKEAVSDLRDSLNASDVEESLSKYETLKTAMAFADSETDAMLLAVETASLETEEALSDEASEKAEQRRQEFEEKTEGENETAAELLSEIGTEVEEGEFLEALDRLDELDSLLHPERENESHGTNPEVPEAGSYEDAQDYSKRQSDMCTEAEKEVPELSSDKLLDISGAEALTDEIKELADNLSTPLEVYNYLKNTINYSNYTGCRKGAAATFDSNSGNDVDQAVLLAAMLRYL